jgi:hypothetical protein
MTGPAIRGAVPDRRIILLTSPQGAAAAALLPGIDQIVSYDAPWRRRPGRGCRAAPIMR